MPNESKVKTGKGVLTPSLLISCPLVISSESEEDDRCAKKRRDEAGVQCA